MIRRLLALLCATLLPLSCAALADSAPRVVASILPLYSLVAAVMDGVGRPSLIVDPNASPHTYTMRPSGAAALARADVVFWMGEDLETFLVRPLANLATKARRVALLRTPALVLYPNRASGPWERETEHERSSSVRDHLPGHIDPHVWLDPRNAAILVQRIATVLSQVDPGHSARYRANAVAVEARLTVLDRELARRLAPVRGIPFLVFHDAYQYLDRRYGLNAVGSIVSSPDRLPGARRITQLRQKVLSSHARCLFREPQFSSPLGDRLARTTRLREGVLDPLGSAYPPGPEAYFRLMKANADAIVECLSGD